MSTRALTSAENLTISSSLAGVVVSVAMLHRLWAALSSRGSESTAGDGPTCATHFLSHLTTNVFFSNLVRQMLRAGAFFSAARVVEPMGPCR